MINTTIETYDGSIANKKDCRFIKGDFYIKNKQCFLISGTWYRINSGFITFDYEDQKWVITKDTPGLIKGVIDYDLEKDEIIFGYYSPNPYKNITVYLPNGNNFNCLDWKLLPPSKFVEDTYHLVFKHINCTALGSNENRIPKASLSANGYPYQLPYCTKHYPEDLYQKFITGVKESKENTTRLSDYISSIGKYSFGFEFETNNGKIPNYRLLETGLLPLRDGSINGIEFATIPLSGEKGVNILENICESLKKYTTFTENESLHLHLGNIPTNKKFIGSLYTICCILEKDIFSLFPKYYAQTSKFKARAKDYNMPLKKELVAMTPEETFDNIAFYLSEGKKYQGMGSEHPSDPEGQHKWQINCR